MSSANAYQVVALEVPAQLPQATQGKAFSYSFSSGATGGTGPPYIWKIVGSLPSGLHLNSSTGRLGGVVAKSAKIKTYALKICATGSKRPVTGTAPGNTACVTTKLRVLGAQSTPKPTPAPTSTLRVTTIELPVAISGQEYRATIVATGGRGASFCNLRPGSSLPVGYAIVPNTCIITGRGAILGSGITRTISAPFTITVTDSAVPPASVNVTFTITTYVPEPVITMIPAVCAALVLCNVQVATATSGTPPYHFVSTQFAGGLPPLGMSVDINGRLIGIASAQGIFTFGVCAVDSVARQSCQATTVTVTPPPNFRITITKNGDGQGTVSADSGSINCGATCQGDYVVGTRVTLTVNPAVGSVFSNWSGACTGAGTCTLTLNADSAVTATFTASATGTYSGDIDWPNIQPAGISGNCGAQKIYRSISLQESQGGKIVGNINNGVSVNGTRVGSAITVTLPNTAGGLRGPYTWQWNGATLSGTLPAICYDTSTGAVLSESSYTFNLLKK
jgi:hypothetical protein